MMPDRPKLSSLTRKRVHSTFLCPRHDNGRCIKTTPVRPYVRTSRRRPLSKPNTFDQNFRKLGHIVQYHNVFFKFDKAPYRTRLLVVMALCL